MLEEHFCEIILKLGHWPRRKCLKNFFPILAIAVVLFSAAALFEQFW